jgi:Flp pilus assembly protein TadB
MESEIRKEKTEIAGAEFSRRALAAVLVLCVAVVVFALSYYDEPLKARATLIAGICLILWLSETVPAYVPTFVL